MKSIIKRLILAGLATLPAACATYSRQYYDTGYNYTGYDYYPSQYGSSYGYGVVERNYYNTYSYPTPVYRTEEHHHHHYPDGRDRRYADRHDHDGWRYQNSPGTFYRKPGHRDHDAKAHYNWNAQTAKPYDNRRLDRDRPGRDGGNEGQQRRPDTPTAYGQWRRQQNWDRQEAKRQGSGFGERSNGRNGGDWRNSASTVQRNEPDRQPRQRPGRWRDREQADAQSGQ